jgi:hypothetical protein
LPAFILSSSLYEKDAPVTINQIRTSSTLGQRKHGVEIITLADGDQKEHSKRPFAESLLKPPSSSVNFVMESVLRNALDKAGVPKPIANGYRLYNL